MEKQCWADSHTHSSFSYDALDTVKDMYRQAQRLGLSYLTITDHCECNDFVLPEAPDWNFEEASYASYQAIRAQPEASGGTRLLCGVELGEPLQGPETTQRVLSRTYDFVLGSLHNAAGYPDFFGMDYSDKSQDYADELLRVYFRELREMVLWGRIDSLSHLSYPIRYMRRNRHLCLDLNRYHVEIDAVFEALVKAQIALEINTSGLRQELSETLPDFRLLCRYYELGGRLITIGSDAHNVKDLGAGLKEGLQSLYRAGFREYAVYIQHDPLMIPIKGSE